MARGQRRLPRAAGPLIRVNAPLGRMRRSGLLHLFQGSGGTLSKNLQGDSPLSSPLPQRNIWMFTCYFILSYNHRPHRASLYHPSDRGHSVLSGSSISVCAKTLLGVPSQEPGFPVSQSLVLPCPLLPPPPHHTHRVQRLRPI